MSNITPQELRQIISSSVDNARSREETFMSTILAIQFVTMGWLIELSDLKRYLLIILMILVLVGVILNFCRYSLNKKLSVNNLNLIYKIATNENVEAENQYGNKAEDRINFVEKIIFILLVIIFVITICVS